MPLPPLAWAVGLTKGWWWPTNKSDWPDGVAREWTIEAFVAIALAVLVANAGGTPPAGPVGEDKFCGVPWVTGAGAGSFGPYFFIKG